MANLTIRDIARLAGVSTTAVSFVLNDKPGVSEDTRLRVKEIIASTGFTPNVHTRRLNLGRSFTIHVVLYWHQQAIFNQFALEIMYGIFASCKRLGYSVMFTFIDRTWDVTQLMESIHSKDCDGLILSQVEDPSFISLLQQENIPFVCVDSHVKKDGNLPLVEVDYYKASYDATQYLARMGHKDIGYIGSSTPHELHESTFNGYIDAMRDEGLACNPAWIGGIEFSATAAGEFFDSLVEGRFSVPTAFFCTGDAFSVNLLNAAKRHGYRIPDDLSIVSVDDLLVSRYVSPALSTMSFDKEALGAKAVDVLHAIINDEPHQTITMISPEILERDSVKRLN